MNGGGEPEAGSEFANGAAAAGEVRRPGFGVTVYHLQGIRAWPGCACKIILVLFILQCLFQIYPWYRAKKGVLGSKELTPLSEPRRLGSWGEAARMGNGEGGNACVVGGGAWRMWCVGNSLGPIWAAKLWISCLFSKCQCLSGKWVVTLYSFPGVATEESRIVKG